MLSDLENKIASVVRDGLAGRDHVRVVRAPGVATALAAGKGLARVAIDSATPRAVFDKEQIDLFDPVGLRSRRVVPIDFTGGIAFQFRPVDTSDANLAGGRDTMLEDLSRALHHLAGDPSRFDSVFEIAAPDPEFHVTAFEVVSATTSPTLADDMIAGELRFKGEATLWRRDVAGPEGEIRAVEPLVTTFPVSILVERPVIAPGESTRLRLRTAVGVRGRDGTSLAPDTRTLLNLAICLPTEPDIPGSIPTGAAGRDAGVRIVPIGAPETVITYNAPAPGPPGAAVAPRTVIIEVRLATPESRKGTLLGSAVIRVEKTGGG